MNLLKLLIKRPRAEETAQKMTSIRDANLRELVDAVGLNEREQIVFKLAFTHGADAMIKHLQEVGYL